MSFLIHWDRPLCLLFPESNRQTLGPGTWLSSLSLPFFLICYIHQDNTNLTCSGITVTYIYGLKGIGFRFEHGYFPLLTSYTLVLHMVVIMTVPQWSLLGLHILCFRQVYNDMYPLLLYHTKYFHCSKIPLYSAYSSVSPTHPLETTELSTVSRFALPRTLYIWNHIACSLCSKIFIN